MGFVEQFVALLHTKHSSNHKHILSALLALSDGHSAATAECRRSEFLLKDLLEGNLARLQSRLEGSRDSVEDEQLEDDVEVGFPLYARSPPPIINSYSSLVISG